MINWSLVAGIVGSITGVISLVWHIVNSRSKVILEKVFFTKSNRHIHKIPFDVDATIRNKSNRATTIEEVYFLLGNFVMEIGNRETIKIEPNSSYRLKFTQSISPEDFNEMLKTKKIKLGLDIIHTFGRMKKEGYTDFTSPFFNL